MRKRILYLINHRIQFHLFYSFIQYQLEKDSFDIYLAAGNEEVWKDIQSSFSIGLEPANYEPAIVTKVRPDIVLCQEVWSSKTVAILREVRGKNIPVLMYDHGSLVFGSYYSLEGDEYLVNYRSNTVLCSHIACWGERGKECWEEYAVQVRKIEVTGAPQYDRLYQKLLSFDREMVYGQLKIDRSKKIILYFTNMGHPGIDQGWNQRETGVLRSLEKYCNKYSDYQLVVKPHPSAMLSVQEPPALSPKTILVANQYEDAWKEVVRIDIDELCAFVHVAISSASSVLIAPLILNVPIIHIELDMNVSKSFSDFGKEVFFNLKKGEKIQSKLLEIEKYFNEKRKRKYSTVLKQLNYNNDGGAADRLQNLIFRILEEKGKGQAFYKSEEAELLLCLEQYPGLPYQYQNLIVYYANNGSENSLRKAEKLLNEYCQRFKNPYPIFKTMKRCYYQKERTPAEIKCFLERFKDKDMLITTRDILKLATVNRDVGNGTAALLYLDELIKRDTKKKLKSIIFYEYGLTLLLMNYCLDEAIHYFRKALKGTSTGEELKYRIYFRLGETYNKLNRYAHALLSFKRCLKQCPAHRAASANLKELKKKMSIEKRKRKRSTGEKCN